MWLYKKMRKGISIAVIITFCSNMGLSQSAFASGTMLKPKHAVERPDVLTDIGNKDGGLVELLTTAKALNLQPQTFSDFRTYEAEIAGPMLAPLQGFVQDINKATILNKIGFIYQSDPQERAAQIEALLQEINKELALPGTGILPKIVVISDYHGGLDRFLALLSDALAELVGFQGKLVAGVSIEKQLQDQGLSLKTIKGSILLNGDLLDRGKSGLACFNVARELLQTAPDRVFYVSGNHDLWAFLNLAGLHLPWYKGYNFYGNERAELLIKTHRSESQYFDTPQALNWWTERLAEYNADQEKFQKEALDGNAAKIRTSYIEQYKKYSDAKKWDSAQLDAMENFIGHFARIDVPDPFVGLNGLGKTSVVWWKDLQQQLIKGKEARSSLGADAEEISVWSEAIAVTEMIIPQLESRLQTALDQGKWYYSVFEAINNQAYASVEWWAKDWSSHKDWGTSVITELNAMIKDANNNDPMIVKDRDIFNRQEVTQANYIRSAKLQDLAAFYKNNFNLGLRTPYGDMLTHGLLPIKGDDVVITYKDKEYKGKAIFDVLKLLSDEIKEATDTGSMREALDLVNSWYADATTIAKPKNVKDLLGKIAAVVSKLGVRIWAMGHNPVNKVKAPVISTDAKDARFSVVQLDFGMAPKFGGAGAYAAFGANGIVVKGFETDKTDEAIKISPDTIIAAKKEGEKPTVIKNPGMPAKAYLENTKAALEEELKGLPVLQKAALTPEAQAQAQFVQDLSGIVEVTPTGVKVLDKGLFMAKGLYVLAEAAALSPSADVKTAAKRITLELLPQFGIKAASDHDFYMAKQQGKWKNITVPAVNGRSTVFMSFRPMFRVAKEENVGVIKTEVARSEMRYSAQDSAEIVAITGLAAIAEGWTGLLFVQQDHNQIDKDKYKKGGADRQKEIDARNELFRDGIAAGQYNIDLDPSTLVDEDALAEIIKIEGELVAQYQAKHPELLKGIENDDKAMGSLRRRLVDEIEMGDIEDKDFLAQADVVAKINRLATELYPQMHKTSIEATMNDIRTIRKLEKEMGLTKSTSIGIEERHIDNKVHKDFPSTVLGSVTLSQSILKLARAEGLVAHSKISLQTGAMHGLGGTVDFGIYERHVKHAKEIGVAVFVQHGASTLAKHDFDKMRDGDVGEVHLATEYQKIVFSIVAQEYPELAEKMAQWLEAKMANEQKFKDKYQAFWDAAMAQPGKDRATVIADILGDSSNLPKDLKGKFKDLVKELSAPFKSELWNLPDNVADKIDSALYEEFKLIFGKLGVVNTKDLIESIMPYDAYPVELTPRPAAVATVFAKKAAFDSAVVVDPVLVTAGGVTEILKTVAGMQNKAIVFYGPAAQAMKILAKGSSNILTADNEVAAVEQLIKDKGISPAKIRLVTTELKESVKSTGITQKIVSAKDPVGIMFALAKAETENTPVPEAADAFAKLYAAVEKSGVIPVDATARDKILAVVQMVAENVDMKSNVQVADDQKKVIEQIALKIGV